MSIFMRKLLPSTGALAAFDAVARTGSFTAAAEMLSLTQSAVSRQVALLEAQLGTSLFERTSRSVDLTEAGRVYAAAIEPALGEIRRVTLQLMTKRNAETLDLAILPTFGTRWLMPRIPRFVAAHPGITLNFATRIGHFDFAHERLDAAIHIGRPVWPGAECRFLMGETVAPVCSPDFLAHHKITGPSDLVALPRFHIASRPGAWGDWFAASGLRQTGGEGMRFEQFALVAQAAMAGLGVALMPLFLIEAELSEGHLVIAYPDVVDSPSAYYLVAPSFERGGTALAAFSDWILGEASTPHPHTRKINAHQFSNDPK
ncbi:LysR family transcriptional regulator (plasmid) [Aureimonas sp. SA4125]|uniref:LysR family transcriptional regulator n=1 Tax=Aureimonas sp. SA4125 TaxID=2826993 RepID=UPI001CC4F682|nr:LysR family transcriptional regulator [Aureimonas sp. SA4125]BDA87156.1 LysR family transcriptional regulator [Aureimonas sp. SA4125]